MDGKLAGTIMSMVGSNQLERRLTFPKQRNIGQRCRIIQGVFFEITAAFFLVCKQMTLKIPRIKQSSCMLLRNYQVPTGPLGR